MKIERRALLGLGAGLSLLAGMVGNATAETSRSEMMRMVVAFAAGGVVDAVARAVANQLSEQTGNTVIVDNRGGAGGELAVMAVAKANPDGKTFLFHTSSHVINATLRGKAKETAAAFEPLARIGAVKFVLVVRKGLPANSIADIIKLSNAGTRLSYGSTGPGTTLHIAAEMLKDQTGIKAVHVPYRGLGPAFTDLVSGNIDFIVTSVGGVLPYVEAGTVRPIATFDEERAEQLPNVPTTGELGYKELEISNWFGLFAPVGVPKDVHKTLEQQLLTVLRSPQMQKTLNTSGLYGVRDAAQFKKFVDTEFERWPAILKRLNIGEAK